VDQHPFPGRGQGGEQPPPDGSALDGATDGPVPEGMPGGPPDDWDGDAEMAAFLADIEAGRARVPEPWETSDAL
jgi:hypothetical protein